MSEEDEIKDYYHQLAAATKSVPPHYVLTVTGDFNAKIGLDNAKFAYHICTNRNGAFMQEYAHENDLVLIQNPFKKFILLMLRLSTASTHDKESFIMKSYAFHSKRKKSSFNQEPLRWPLPS